MPDERRAERTEAETPEPPAMNWRVRAYEIGFVVPVVAWFVFDVIGDPASASDPLLLEWVIAIAVVDLLPIPTAVGLPFSLSFPLQLSVALIYSPAVAGGIVFLGSTDVKELRLEAPFWRALWNRAQIAVSVVIEGWVFHHIASLESRWFILGPAVFLAAMMGYVANALAVAVYMRIRDRAPVVATLREMHVGVFGEFLLSYMGLALFAVVVATTFVNIGPWSIAVFIAPMAFARQMFTRTHSLQEATVELEAKTQENEWQAFHDALTGLPNRMLFLRHLHDAIEGMGPGDRLAVMIMDLDHFKEINDTLGHHFGDQLLQQIGPRLSEVLREGDLMARLGGDEFGVVLPELPDDGVAIRIAERLIEELEQPLSVENLALDVSGSIGIAIYPAHSDDVETLIRRADVAMYAAKESGGGFEVYQSSMDEHNPTRLALVAGVRPGIENREFILHYQPKVRLSDGRTAGVEALVRWEHPERGLVFPDDFIPLVEHTVLLRPLTNYILDQALQQWHVWSRRGIEIEMAVNLSTRSLLDSELPQHVADLLERWDVPARFLTLEITESVLMADSARSMGVLAGLSDVGVRMSIDDFGTGYSSMSYLKRLPISEIKVDRSFVMNMRRDPNDTMIVRATVELGKNLGLQVVAEGVEDRESYDDLAEMGCDLAQGYLISRPIPAADATRWLEQYAVRSRSGEGDDGRPALHVV